MRINQKRFLKRVRKEVERKATSINNGEDTYTPLYPETCVHMKKGEYPECSKGEPGRLCNECGKWVCIFHMGRGDDGEGYCKNCLGKHRLDMYDKNGRSVCS